MKILVYFLAVGLQAVSTLSSIDVHERISGEASKNLKKLTIISELDEEVEVLQRLVDSDENGIIVWVIEVIIVQWSKNILGLTVTLNNNW